MNLRSARASDRPALLRLLKANLPSAQLPDSDDAVTLVAEEGNDLLGCGTLLPTGELVLLCVEKSQRRKGIGATLCAFLEMQLPLERLTVAAPPAVRPFFQHQGYRPAGGVLEKELV